MSPDVRYILACARLASLADPSKWTADDLTDVAALVSPTVPYDVWAGRVALSSTTHATPPSSATHPAPHFGNCEDPATTETMASILAGHGKPLIDLGVLSVEEKTA
jgi:hypothetical protein